MTDYFEHPQRFPKNMAGPFYTLGDIDACGNWCGRCLSCGVPEAEAPSLLAPLTGTNSDTYFVRQPQTDEEIEQACSAVQVCCVDALRYGGSDPSILQRLCATESCDFPLRKGNQRGGTSASRRWWAFWK